MSSLRRGLQVGRDWAAAVAVLGTRAGTFGEEYSRTRGRLGVGG